MTLVKLKDRIPKLCKSNKSLVQDRIRSGTLFPEITDSTARSQILENLLLVNYPIPTLNTFFENIKFLQPLSKAIKGLLDPPTPNLEGSADKSETTSISMSFKRIFSNANQKKGEVLIQTQRYSLRPYPKDDSDRICLGI